MSGGVSQPQYPARDGAAERGRQTTHLDGRTHVQVATDRYRGRNGDRRLISPNSARLGQVKRQRDVQV